MEIKKGVYKLEDLKEKFEEEEQKKAEEKKLDYEKRKKEIKFLEKKQWDFVVDNVNEIKKVFSKKLPKIEGKESHYAEMYVAPILEYPEFEDWMFCVTKEYERLPEEQKKNALVVRRENEKKGSGAMLIVFPATNANGNANLRTIVISSDKKVQAILSKDEELKDTGDRAWEVRMF